ncbi:MAG: hotdog fold thioesterase [Chitinophagaceae bacterium]|jgi:1,4-dihydroxy-2-naphthoyl-CoA hydrolase|nr:hotdog fold thioesterase [Chitinophagaceae bacterium]
MSIWFKKDLKIEDFAHWPKGTMSEHLGMQFTTLGDDYLEISMPVDGRTKQPYGLLHGGASVALAETVGSVASALVVDHSKFLCVGLEINANHIRSAREGTVTATCKPVHLGAATHVWDIRINDAKGKLVCISRLTVAILERKDSK